MLRKEGVQAEQVGGAGDRGNKQATSQFGGSLTKLRRSIDAVKELVSAGSRLDSVKCGALKTTWLRWQQQASRIGGGGYKGLEWSNGA